MIIDTNVSLGRWPFQRFGQDTPAKLFRHLNSEGISWALISSIDAVLYPDPDLYNKILFKQLKPYHRLLPVPVLNPSLTGWQERLNDYIGSRKVKAVKIFPNYHHFSLSAQFVEDLMTELTRGKVPLFIQMRLEDARNRYLLMKIPVVETKSVIGLSKRFPKVPIVCLCPYLHEAVSLVNEAPNIYVDIAFTETLNTISSLLGRIPVQRILFGSHTPFCYTRSAIMKVKSAKISPREEALITFGNLQNLVKSLLP